MIKFLLVAFFAIMPFLANANLITNGDFSDGMKGFGLSDDYPQNLDARIGKDIVIGNYLAYKSKKNSWGGLNISEVYLGPTGTYKLSFKAKASIDLTIDLIVMAYSKNIYRCRIKDFHLGTDWQEFTCYINAKTIRRNGTRDWVPFRIEKKSAKFPFPETPEAELFFADFKLEQLDAKGKLDSAEVSTLKSDINLVVRKSKIAKCKYAKWGVVSKTDRLLFNAKFVNKADKPQVKKVGIKIFNETLDKLVYEDSEEREIPVGKSVIKYNIPPVKNNGRYLASLIVDDKEVSYTPFTATPRVRAPKGVLPIDIGYCGVLTNGERGKPTTEEMEFLADTGISFIRTWDSGNPFNWRCVEPNENEYFWDITDATVRLANKYNLDVLPVLGGMFFIYPPEMGMRGHRQADWLYKKSEVVRPIVGFERQGRKAIKPPMEDWNRMVRAVATRYKGKIKYFEIMNEPNIIWFDPLTYYPYLESANKIIKGIDPENKIVGFSTTGDYGGNPNGFLAQLLRANAGQFSDIISFHSYSSLYEDSPKPADVLIKDFYNTLAKYNVKQPLWHTELYYMNPMSKLGGADHENGPRFHPGYLARRYLVDVSSGVKASLLLPAAFTAIHRTHTSTVKTEKFSQGNHMPFPTMSEMCYQPSDIFIVSAVFAQTLKNTDYVKKHTLKDSLIAYEFAEREGTRRVATVFALGSYMDNISGTRTNLKTKMVDKLERTPKDMGKIPAGIEVFDVFGNKMPVKADGSFVLPISPIPIYIEAKDQETLDSFLGKLK